MTNTSTSNNDDALDLFDQERLGEKLMSLYSEIVKSTEKGNELYPLSRVHENEASRDNLLGYLSLRQHNLEALQLELAENGLSSLGRLEGHVLTTLELVLKHFKPQSYFDIINEISKGLKKITRQESQNVTLKRSRLLLGRPRKGRSTRIMVTLDLESIHQPHLLEELLIHGMDIARINCAHDTPREWKMLIDSIRQAEERLVQRGQDIGRRCRIVMDLAGSKIRTCSTGLEMRPLKIGVSKDIYGRTIKMVEGFLDAEARFTEKINLTGVPPSFIVSIKKGSEELLDLDIGERLSFYDSRGRYRTMTVLERISPTRVKIGLDKTSFFSEGIALRKQKYREYSRINTRIRNEEYRTHSAEVDSTGGLIGANLNPAEAGIQGGGDDTEYDKIVDDDVNGLLIIGNLSPQPTDILVKSGDTILVRKKKAAIEPNSPVRSRLEKHIAGEITCSLPEILESVEVGHRVYIDDGKINSIVRSSTDEYLELEILAPSLTTAKIKPEKGLNFPDSNLNLPALTSRDINNLGFIVNNATAVGLSFVHSSDDIRIVG